MQYLDFYKLSYKNFKRSPNFSKNLFLKILGFLGYILLFLYLISFALLAYFGIKEKFPDTNTFQKANEFLFIYFFIIFYVLMYINFDSMKVKPFMLLPVSKQKITRFHLWQVLVHPANIALLSMLIIYTVLIAKDGYNMVGLIAWSVAIAATLYTINFVLFFSNRNQWMGMLMSLLFFVIIFKIKWMIKIFSPVGDIYYQIYLHPYRVGVALFILGLSFFSVYRYLYHHLYIDDAVKAGKTHKNRDLRLKWTENLGLTGSFIRNDIRLVLRNSRPRQALPGLIIFFLMAGFLFSDLGAQTHQPEFYKIMFTMFLTGYFVIQFGNFIPAWDSEYYPLLMTQGINYRQYIESKWWLLTMSVLVLSILAIPFVFFGWKVLILIWIMAVFNAGVNIPLVLLTGVYNTQPIKLNQKVKAFQSNQNFRFKTFMVSLLRLFIPILIYMLLDKYAGFNYAAGFFALLGITGLILKNKIIDFISSQYAKRKYITLSAFKKADES